jgi:hypothetical protein
MDAPKPRRKLRMKVRRTCPVCRTRFRAKQRNAKYCSAACCQKAYRRRQWFKRMREYLPASLLRWLS